MTYPASIDELTDGVPSDGAAPTTALDNATYPHDDHHRALAVAVEAIETELGTDPAGSQATVKERIAAVETLADAAQTASEVATAVASEATLARNGDNITSGTVADGRIASTIARDSEVAAAYQPLDADLTALANAGNSTVLANTTASFVTADETKLDGIEALADVTDATNVDAAGALMKSLGTTQGDTIYFTGSATPARLAKGTAAQVLTMNAGATAPEWAAAAAGGSFNPHPLLNLTVNSVPASGVPGVTISKVDGTAIALGAGVAYYTPLVVEKALTITAAEVRVTTQAAGANTARIAIYNAANTWQPGTLVTGGDLGTVSTQTTGRKTITSLSVALAPGIYLVRLHNEATASFKPHNGECDRWTLHHLAQNHPPVATTKTLTYAVAESPGTAADGVANGAVGVLTFASFIWTTPVIIRNESRNAQTGVVTAQVIDTIASTLTPEVNGVPGQSRPLTAEEINIYITQPAAVENKTAIETNLEQDQVAMQTIIDTAATSISIATFNQAQQAARDALQRDKDIARNLKRLNRTALKDYDGTT